MVMATCEVGEVGVCSCSAAVDARSVRAVGTSEKDYRRSASSTRLRPWSPYVTSSR